MYVRTIDPLAHTPSAIRRSLWGLAFRRKLRRGEVLILGGHTGDQRVHLIRRGSVRIAGRDAAGNEATVDICGEGELLGLASLLLDGTEPCDAVALTETIVYSFPGALTVSALLSEPAAARSFLTQVVRSHVRAVKTAVERATGDATARLAGRLLDVTETCGDGSGSVPKLSQKSLGQLAGLSREHVCREMTLLRRAGIIDYGTGGLRIHRPDLLERIRCGARAGGPSRSVIEEGHRRSV